jgi:hypothetical protein
LKSRAAGVDHRVVKGVLAVRAKNGTQIDTDKRRFEKKMNRRDAERAKILEGKREKADFHLLS